MGLLGDFDSQLMAFRMDYAKARSADQPDDAIHYAKLLWSSLPKDIRESNPLPEIKLDRSLRCKLDTPSLKWRWCRIAVPIIERAITDNRDTILRKYRG